MLAPNIGTRSWTWCVQRKYSLCKQLLHIARVCPRSRGYVGTTTSLSGAVQPRLKTEEEESGLEGAISPHDYSGRNRPLVCLKQGAVDHELSVNQTSCIVNDSGSFVEPRIVVLDDNYDKCDCQQTAASTYSDDQVLAHLSNSGTSGCDCGDDVLTAQDRSAESLSGGDPTPDTPGHPAMPWDEDIAAHCEHVTSVQAGGPAPAAGLAHLCASAERAARRADHAAFTDCWTQAQRLGVRAVLALQPARLELLWRRGMFEPAVGMVLRYLGRGGDASVQLAPLLRRAAVCCCLAAEHGCDAALPHLTQLAAEAARHHQHRLLLSVWQQCVDSRRHGWAEAGLQLLLTAPVSRQQLPEYLSASIERAQLAGSQRRLRVILEHVLALGEARFYPLVFGALLDLQCAEGDAAGARHTWLAATKLSVQLPASVLDRYSQLLWRRQLRVPAALLRSRHAPPPARRKKPPPPSPAAPVGWYRW